MLVFNKIKYREAIVMKRSFIREILEHITNETISFAGGLPDESMFPLDNLRKAATKALMHSSSLQYGTSTGNELLKEKIAQFYTEEGFETTSDNILITSGSQQALDIIARYNQGRNITIEAPSYLGAMNVFNLNSVTQEAVTLENDGVNTQAFEESFKRTKMSYLIPDFQNPTGRTYSLDKRRIIANLIEKYDGVLIEDGPYSELYFKQKNKSISSLIPSHSFHLGSFSKTLAPSLRLGWIRADQKLLQPLIAYKEAMDLHTNGLAQHILYNYLHETNDFKDHLSILRKHYEEKMQIFSQALDELIPEFIYTKPEGGMFIYGKLPNINTTLLVRKCLEEGVVFVPGSEFYSKDTRSDEIRFNFTHCNSENIYKGLKLIQKILYNIEQEGNPLENKAFRQ